MRRHYYRRFGCTAPPSSPPHHLNLTPFHWKTRHTRIVKKKNRRIKWNLWFLATFLTPPSRRMASRFFSFFSFFIFSYRIFLFRIPTFVRNKRALHSERNTNRIKYINFTQDNMNDGFISVFPHARALSPLSLSQPLLHDFIFIVGVCVCDRVSVYFSPIAGSGKSWLPNMTRHPYPTAHSKIWDNHLSISAHTAIDDVFLIQFALLCILFLPKRINCKFNYFIFFAVFRLYDDCTEVKMKASPLLRNNNNNDGDGRKKGNSNDLLLMRMWKLFKCKIDGF